MSKKSILLLTVAGIGALATVTIFTKNEQLNAEDKKKIRESKEYLESKGFEFSDVNYSLSEWIEKYVYDDWFVLSLLKFDIGIHDGTLPKHITSSIINYFNQGKIKFIICTYNII